MTGAISAQSILNEVISRLANRFDIGLFCFKEQLAFINDTAQFKTAVCSRRAGKTIACAADLISTALQFPGVVCLYITLSRVNAKRIIWPELKKINTEFNLGGVPNESELSLKFVNGSTVYCSGAKHKQEIENFRGLALKKVYVDECQSFRAYIQDLIDDVIAKALFDYAGTLCLIGTPGHVPNGYFYDTTKSEHWTHHAWTMFENPHLTKKSGKTTEELVMADCKRMGVTIDHPKIQRECFGKWAVDTDSLIFKYDPLINHFDNIPTTRGQWSYVIGVDVGHDDADAIAVIGWNEYDTRAYLIEEIIKTKQGVTELADALDALVLTYKPLKIVMDTGGLGKKIAAEITRRRAIAVAPAEKSRKMEFIELLNDAMRTARFFAKKTSAFAQDCFLVERDDDKTTVDKIVVSDRYHSDIGDAVLYAFRESLHWLSEPEEKHVPHGTPEWRIREEREMEEAAEAMLEQQNQDDNWDVFSND